MMTTRYALFVLLMMFASSFVLGCSRNVLVIAHRGNSSQCPENTLAAMRSGIQAGADYIETDTYPSADGTLVCLHDKTLDRTTNAVAVLGGNKILVQKTKDSDLAKLDAGTWFDKKFAGEKLPTLVEALDLVQANSKMLLERKEGAAEQYAKLLQEKKMVGKLIVQAFDWDFLVQFHKIMPEQPLWALGSKELTEEKFAKISATGAVAIAWDYKNLNAETIRTIQQKGYKAIAWTSDKPEEWESLVAGGIDGIITNKPAELRAWLKTK